MRQELPQVDSWFAVRCHFRHLHRGSTSPQRYEERITLWRAADVNEAIALAEREALNYAHEMESEYLNSCSAFHLFDSGFGVSGKEVFSEMRLGDLGPTAYLEAFFFTGAENSRVDCSPPNWGPAP